MDNGNDSTHGSPNAEQHDTSVEANVAAHGVGGALAAAATPAVGAMADTPTGAALALLGISPASSPPAVSNSSWSIAALAAKGTTSLRKFKAAQGHKINAMVETLEQECNAHFATSAGNAESMSSTMYVHKSPHPCFTHMHTTHHFSLLWMLKIGSVTLTCCAPLMCSASLNARFTVLETLAGQLKPMKDVLRALTKTTQSQQAAMSARAIEHVRLNNRLNEFITAASSADEPSKSSYKKIVPVKIKAVLSLPRSALKRHSDAIAKFATKRPCTLARS